MSTHSPLMIDIAGTVLTAKDRQRLRNPLVGGLTLFGRNWENRAQLSALCASIKRVRPDLLIAVDHEGGRVQRFKTDGFVHLPPMCTLGALWESPKGGVLAATRAALACGFVMGAQLRACGVDMSFAPVLDLDYGSSSVIGERAFSHDPRVVSWLAQSLIQGMDQAGLGHCGKHFPGHGYARADSHLAVPRDRRSLRAISARDTQPYASLDLVLRAVMPAHVVYPKVDALPAGFSKFWLQTILRQRLGFEGAVFSDDLSMAGARQVQGQEISITQAAMAALGAGCDMVLLCNQSTLETPQHSPLDALLAELTQALTSGPWRANAASHGRRIALLGRSGAPGWDALLASPQFVKASEVVSRVSQGRHRAH